MSLQEPEVRSQHFPSQALPGTPSFTFAVPTGWVASEAPNALAMVQTPEPVGGFWVNLTIDHESVPSALGLKHVVEITRTKLGGAADDLRIENEKAVRTEDNRVMYLIEVSFAGTGDQRVGQLHALTLGPRSEMPRRYRPLFRLVGTAPAATMSGFGPLFVGVCRSFTVTA